MANFGAMPFELDAGGKAVFGKPRTATSEIGARCLAAAMVATYPGAVVFSHKGLGATGELTDVVVIESYEAAVPETALMKEAA
jgi:hypothetical protein